MNNVLILMSTFNGGLRIKRQVNDILNQEGVSTTLLIRDDGSEKETISLLKDLKEHNSNRIVLILGENMGYKKSFHALLQSKYAHKYDYYGFSDQDDVWMPDKLSTCIGMMEADDWKGPKLSHCSALAVDNKLQMRKEQERRVDKPLNHKNAFATECFQGCAMVWNQDCMELIQRHTVNDPTISHDYWVGLIGYLFGKVYFCREPKFYHIRYNNSVSSDGNVNKGRMERVKALFTSDDVYMNPACDLLEGYSDLLNSPDKNFLKCMSDYKSNFNDKMQIIFDKNFCRPSKLATMLMKCAVMVNKF